MCGLVAFVDPKHTIEPDTHLVVRRVQALSTLQRVQTGTSAIDRACRGGVPLGKRVVVGGAPGAGKTGLVTQWAVNLAESGARVLILATDEAADAIAIRVGQQLGGDRDRLERGDLTGAREIPPSLAIHEDLTIEAAARLLGRSGPRVLVVDSLQTARSDAYHGGAKRGQVEAVVRALKTVARGGVLVVATSELARRGYQGRAAKPGQGDYKGSGDIEYDVDLGLAMVTHDGGASSEVCVVKSRLGAKPTFTLHWNPVCATFSEAPTSPTSSPTYTLSELEPDMWQIVRAFTGMCAKKLWVFLRRAEFQFYQTSAENEARTKAFTVRAEW